MTNRRGKPSRLALEEHKAAVEKAYREKVERKRRAARKDGGFNCTRANLLPGNPNLHKERRKCAGTRRDGKPCNAPALTGATLCRRHGGYRQNPAHPGSIARLTNGKLALAIREREAWEVWREAPVEAQRAVLQAATQDPRRAHAAINRAEGACAYIAAERGDGAPWRAWIAKQPAIAAIVEPTRHDPRYARYWKQAEGRF